MTERRRRTAVAALAATLGLQASAPSPAQQSAVARCREAPSDEARIACLERALTGEAESAEAPVTRSPDRAAVAEPRTAPAPHLETRPETGPAPQADTRPAPGASSRAPTPEQAANGPPAGPSGIGAEQVRARVETGAEREARLASVKGLRVAAYREVPYQRLEVELENGQVWRQIKGDTQHVRVDLERNQTVDIEESTLGGYKLQLNEMRRTIRAERVR